MASKEIVKVNMAEKLPSWFEPKAGFKFTDSDGDLCMVIGWGGRRDCELQTAVTPFGMLEGYEITFLPCTLLYVVLYKGEWNLHETTEEALRDARPGWSPEQQGQVEGWR